MGHNVRTNWFIDNEQTPGLETAIRFVADSTRQLESALLLGDLALIHELIAHSQKIAIMYREAAQSVPTDDLICLHNLEVGEVEMKHLADAANKSSELLKKSIRECRAA